MHWIAVAPVPMMPDPLVVQFVQTAGGIAAGVVVVPATGVEGMPLELLDPRDRGQLGLVQRPARHDAQSAP